MFSFGMQEWMEQTIMAKALDMPATMTETHFRTSNFYEKQSKYQIC